MQRTFDANFNFWRCNAFKHEGLPLSTWVRYSCFISSSRRLEAGYMLKPPERMYLHSSARTSTAALWIVSKYIGHTSLLDVD